jgi:phosphoglycolate phosphatase-like HAD superfamily hydrolase
MRRSGRGTEPGYWFACTSFVWACSIKQAPNRFPVRPDWLLDLRPRTVEASTSHPMKRLLITDLDNTLYDWVTFYARAFRGMTDSLVALLGIPRDQLLDEFKAIHQACNNSEQPFAALDLPSVRKAFPGESRERLAARLAGPFEVFNAERRARLRLYDGVKSTLSLLKSDGVRIVGYTEAIAVNAWYRLRLLEIQDLFSRLYALDGDLAPHPNPGHAELHAPPPDRVVSVPRTERKPNPKLLLHICASEGFAPGDACYIGDSPARDIAMAKRAGVAAVLARYGQTHDEDDWELLVRITHWTAADVAGERGAPPVEPDYEIDGFAALRAIMR